MDDNNKFGPAGENQPSGAEVDMRVDQVRRWLLAKYRRAEIVKLCTEQFGVSTIRGDQYIRMAKDIIDSYRVLDLEENIKLALQEAEEDYREAKMAGDKKHTYLVKKHMDTLRGLITRKIDVTSAGQPISAIKIEIIDPNNKKENGSESEGQQSTQENA